MKTYDVHGIVVHLNSWNLAPDKWLYTIWSKKSQLKFVIFFFLKRKSCINYMSSETSVKDIPKSYRSSLITLPELENLYNNLLISMQRVSKRTLRACRFRSVSRNCSLRSPHTVAPPAQASWPWKKGIKRYKKCRIFSSQFTRWLVYVESKRTSLPSLVSNSLQVLISRL